MYNFLNMSLPRLSGMSQINPLNLDQHSKWCMCLLCFLESWPKIKNVPHRSFS